MKLQDTTWAFQAHRGARQAKVRPLPLTSMMDMLTIILIFLLLNLTPDYVANRVDKDIQLPTAVKGTEPIGAHRIEVSMNAVLLDSEPVAPMSNGIVDAAGLAALTNALTPHFDETQTEPTPVVLLADKQVPYETVDAVLKAAGMAGFPDFRFAVVTLEEGT